MEVNDGKVGLEYSDYLYMLKTTAVSSTLFKANLFVPKFLFLVDGSAVLSTDKIESGRAEDALFSSPKTKSEA